MCDAVLVCSVRMHSTCSAQPCSSAVSGGAWGCLQGALLQCPSTVTAMHFQLGPCSPCSNAHRLLTAPLGEVWDVLLAGLSWCTESLHVGCLVLPSCCTRLGVQLPALHAVGGQQ